MPSDRNIPSAKCHICGQKVPFTYGNPKELIQHMLGCHEQETSQHFKPSCCLSNNPHVKIVQCPNKSGKYTKRQAAGSATVINPPEDAPEKCTICVPSSPPKESICKDSCPTNPNKGASNGRKSPPKNECVPCCPNKSSSPIELGKFTSPMKLRIRCHSNKSQDKCPCKSDEKVCPSRLSEIEKNRKTSGLADRSEKNRRSSSLTPNKVDRKCDCTEKHRSSTPMETKRRSSLLDKLKRNSQTEKMKKSSSSLAPGKCLTNKSNEGLAAKLKRNSQTEKIKTSTSSLIPNACKCRSNISPEKNKRSSFSINKSNDSLDDELKRCSRAEKLKGSFPTSVDKSAVCNKTVCFANQENQNDSKMQYSPCNLIKRKGTKEMYKTTLESWTAGCGSINCPKCHRKVVPLIRKQKNKIAFSSVGASLLLTCWPFCFLIPMMHNCSVDLYCPCCKYKLAVYNSSTGKTTSVCCKTQNT